MLYHLHDLHFASLKPLVAWADVSRKLFTSDVSPLAYLPYSDSAAATCEMIFRLGKHYDKPQFGIKRIKVNEQEIEITEGIHFSKPFCNLLHFKKKTNIKQPTVLLVAPLSGHHSTLLRETVVDLLAEHDVFITDWIDASEVPLNQGDFHLHDYIYYVQEFIKYLGPDCHVIAICQPAVPALAAVSLLATDKEVQPKTMTLMAGPVDGRINTTEVNALAAEKSMDWFEQHLIYRVPPGHKGAGRMVYPGFLQLSAFISMNPQHHLRAHQDFFKNVLEHKTAQADSHRKFYDEYNAVLDMPASFYLETVKEVFQDFSLPNGTMTIEGKLVRPQDIKKTALLAIEGERDDICGIGQTKAALDLCSGLKAEKKEYFLVKDAGHYGVFSGRKWRSQSCPMITDFIRKHS